MPVFSEDNDSEVEFLGTQPIASTLRSQASPSQIRNKIPPLYSLSQDVKLNELPPMHSATTRGSRGVAPKKSRAQLEMESQQKSEIAEKQAKTQAKKLAQEKQTAKAMRLRNYDVSQLVDDFSELGSLPLG